MRSAVAEAIVTGGVRGVAPARYLAEPAFLAKAKELFWANQAKEAPEYERILYNLAPPAEGTLLQRMAAFRGRSTTSALGRLEVETRVTRLMRVVRYPAVEQLLDLKDANLTLPQLTQILHFHHPAYPMFSKELVAGLNRLGIPVVFREELSEESLADYAGVIAALDRLKERVTFENVPESNCFLTRVLEGALVQSARQR